MRLGVSDCGFGDLAGYLFALAGANWEVKILHLERATHVGLEPWLTFCFDRVLIIDDLLGVQFDFLKMGVRQTANPPALGKYVFVLPEEATAGVGGSRIGQVAFTQRGQNDAQILQSGEGEHPT